MRVLIIHKTTSRYTLADYYKYAFQQLGIEAYVLNLLYTHQRERMGYDKVENAKISHFLKERLSQRILDMIWRLKRETHKRLILKIKDIKPDIIMAMGELEIEPDIFGQIRGILKSCRIFLYLTDPLSVENDSVLKNIPLFDFIFTFSKFHIPLIYWFGAKNVIYLPFAYDPRIHRITSLSDKEKEFYGSDIAYLGTWQPYVEFWVKELIAYRLKIWGNQWYKLKGYQQLKICWQGEGVGLYEEMAKVINSSKIIFNVIRYFNGSGHSMKTFEIPACGGFMLSNRAEEQLEFFPEDKCAVYFSTKEELIDKIDFYLKNDVPRLEISKAGYEAAKQHTYSERVKRIMNAYERIKSR